jgi:flavin-dependent dehydrogenase
LRWLAGQAKAAGVSFLSGKRLNRAERDGAFIVLPEFGVKTRFLVGADGARSTVARLFGLGRNKRFLIGVEREYDALPAVDPHVLHCFLDSRLAPGYLAWVAAAPRHVQAGLATAGVAKPHLARFIARSEHLFGFSAASVIERRSGIIPVGGPVRPIGAENVLLIGDAAGHVSPLTGGGIRWALRDGRRAGQLIADRLTRLGPEPHTVLSGAPRFILMKLAMRRMLELGPPGWLYNATLSTSPMHWLARQIYFHRRAQSGESLADFERQITIPPPARSP